MPQRDSDLPLSGIKVLELCHTIMGPACGLILADMGAEVIKVEPSPLGDRTRALQGFQVGTFSYFTRNKKSIGLDLKSAEGRKALHKLIEDTDVLIENYAPATLQKLGIDYPTLSAINPRLIYCSLKGYLNGPYEHRGALDEVIQHQTGIAYMTGHIGSPMRAGVSLVDIAGGMFGALGIFGAMRRREKTGKGALVKSSLYETGVFLVGQHMAGEAVSGVAPLPLPVKDKTWAIYQTFVTRDEKMIFLAVTSNNHWKAFCDLLGLEALCAKPDYATNEARLANASTLLPKIADVVARHDAKYLIDELSARSVPVVQSATPYDLFDDEHLNQAGYLLDTELTNGVKTKLPVLPILIDGQTFQLRNDPPKLGSHTREILAEAGYDQNAIDTMFLTQVAC